MAELDRFTVPHRQPGDIDKWQVAGAKNITLTTAEKLMDRAAASGEFESVKVYDPDRRHTVRVIRRKKA